MSGAVGLIEATGALSRADTLARQAVEGAEEHGVQPRRRPVSASWRSPGSRSTPTTSRRRTGTSGRAAAVRPGADGTAVTAYAIVKSRRLLARGELRGAMKALRDAEAATSPRRRGWPGETRSARPACDHGGRLAEADELLRRFEDRTVRMSPCAGGAVRAAGAPDRAHESSESSRQLPGDPRPRRSTRGCCWRCGRPRGRRGRRPGGAAPGPARRGPEGFRACCTRPGRSCAGSCARTTSSSCSTRRWVRAPDGRRARSRCARRTGSRRVAQQAELDVLRGMAAMLADRGDRASMFVSVRRARRTLRAQHLRKLSQCWRNDSVLTRCSPRRTSTPRFLGRQHRRHPRSTSRLPPAERLDENRVRLAHRDLGGDVRARTQRLVLQDELVVLAQDPAKLRPAW